MSDINFKINSIFGGFSICDYFNSRGQFLCSLGIDPDMPATDAGNKPSGYIRPTAMAKFSGANVSAVPMWILTNPKNALVYVVLSNGKIISYNSSLASETLVGTLTTCIGQGAEYYDNYLYFRKNADVARYGPLNGSPALTQNYWTSTLSLATPKHTTYPTINGVKIPNGDMHRHINNKLYFCDVFAVAGVNANKGILNYIKTKKTIVEGDTDNGSTYNALDFGYGVYPVCIETYQMDLVVALIEGVNTSMMRGKIAFYDTTSVSCTSITSIEAPSEKEIFTAIKNVNGTLYAFSGFLTGGCRVSKIVSGYSLEEVVYLPEEYPPISKGAIDHLVNRFCWGSNSIEPAVAGCVYAIGSKEQKLPSGLQNIIRCTATKTNPMVTAVKFVQSDGKIQLPIIGYKADDSEFGCDKKTTGCNGNNIFRSEVIIPENWNEKFMLKKLRLSFGQAIAANMEIKVYLYVDNAIANRTWTINNTSGHSGKRFVVLYPQIEISNNFFIEIHFTGSALLCISLPITGILEI